MVFPTEATLFRKRKWKHRLQHSKYQVWQLRLTRRESGRHITRTTQLKHDGEKGCLQMVGSRIGHRLKLRLTLLGFFELEEPYPMIAARLVPHEIIFGQVH